MVHYFARNNLHALERVRDQYYEMYLAAEYYLLFILFHAFSSFNNRLKQSGLAAQ